MNQFGGSAEVTTATVLSGPLCRLSGPQPSMAPRKVFYYAVELKLFVDGVLRAACAKGFIGDNIIEITSKIDRASNAVFVAGGDY